MVALTAIPATSADGGGDHEKVGFIGSLDVRGAQIYAAGGTNYRPTLLYSADAGRTFARLNPPTTGGLRDVLSHDGRVWVVGENGMAAMTRDRGATWQTLQMRTSGCLYRIELGPDGWYWITGDGGQVWRTESGTSAELVPTKTQGRVFQVYFDPIDRKPWLLDSTGAIQRWRRGGFRIVPTKAMKSPRPLCWLTRTHTGTLVLVGDRGLVLRSTNDAASWTKIPTHRLSDLEQIVETMYGLLIVGNDGTLLASCNDGRSFTPIETAMSGHLWSIATVEGGIVVGAEEGQVFRIATTELAKILAVAHARDRVLAGLAAAVQSGDVDAELVLADALRDRELW